ncbi:MAG: hypothetical protein ABI700_03115 [Chloroflexota bacterium]
MLEGLLERDIVDEQGEVDLLELSNAVVAEIEFREVEGGVGQGKSARVTHEKDGREAVFLFLQRG